MTPRWTIDLDGERFWSGDYDLTFLGQVYRGADRLMAVSAVELGPENHPEVTFSVAVADATLRESLLRETTAIPITVQWIYSTNDGVTWKTTGFQVSGFLSAPLISDGIYSATVATWSGDATRRTPRQWSPDGQRSRNVNDAGMNDMRRLGQGIQISWPP